MLPVFTHELLRAMNQERLERSLRIYRLLHHVADEPVPSQTADAGGDVIELCFGSGCETAESWGA